MKENKVTDFEFQKDWCVTILQFMSDQYPEDAHSAGQNYRRFFKGKIDAVINGFVKNNRKGMGMAFNDVNSLALNEALNIENLNKVLKEKFGRSLIDESNHVRKKIDKIIKRGKIITKAEFYLAKEYIDELIINKQNVEADKLDSILHDFEFKK